VISGARWTDPYPAWQKDADELEEALNFAKVKGQWDAYLGALQGSNSQRDSALMELRVAKHLEGSGFPVVSWRPVGADNNEGEYIVQGPSMQQTFVEVKSPGWEGEVAPEERKAGRLEQPKYVDLDGRAVAPWLKIRYAVDKAYKKFRAEMPNLLVIADDLFVSLEHVTELHAGQALYSKSRAQPGYFTDARYDKLGGVGFFWLDVREQNVSYQMRLFLNPHALGGTALPPDIQAAFREERNKGPLVGREPSAFEKWLANPSKWKSRSWRTHV
jgi:hypothetical protein